MLWREFRRERVCIEERYVQKREGESTLHKMERRDIEGREGFKLHGIDNTKRGCFERWDWDRRTP